MNERDIHFKKFSELLAYRIGTYYDFYTPPGMLSGEFVSGLEKLLAQTVYDFALHVLKTADLTDDYYGRFRLDDEARTNSVPDLVEWPEKPV